MCNYQNQNINYNTVHGHSESRIPGKVIEQIAYAI